MDMKLKVLEIYSGIGGMHYAVEESGFPAKVVVAVDINEVANAVYLHNFPSSTLLQRNIMSLSHAELNALKPDVILMSPPCQPFTRVGLKKDIKDGRTDSFVHVLEILPSLHTVRYILLENVKGFETSETRNKLISTLETSGFIYQEFLLSPHNFYIPNTRLRYYLIAKKKPQTFCFPTSGHLMTSLPSGTDFCGDQEKNRLHQSGHIALIAKLNQKFFDSLGLSNENAEYETFCIEQILESDINESEFLLSSNTLAKHAQLLDIVTSVSKRSCCFTKAYGRYIEGTGSVFCPSSEEVVQQAYEECKSLETSSDEYINILRGLKMRYFTPKEISRLMCFPNTFSFPELTSTKQKYRLLGNSINVHVVAMLFTLLICEA